MFQRGLRHFDVIVVGAGPGGSLVAMQLARRGRKVALLDRTRFPRFAVGESSTPIASRTLEQISVDFGIPELAPLTRWGQWSEMLTPVTGGLKRGFTYFDHRRGESADPQDTSWPSEPAARLLVAASASDAAGDSHWVRAEVDQYLVEICRRLGVDVRLGWAIDQVSQERPWHLGVRPDSDDGACETLTCDTLMDASGRAGAVLRRLGFRDATESMRVNTSAHFTHLVETASSGTETADGLPYRARDAAVHHLLHDGWVWELPMSDGRASVGRVWWGPRATASAESVATAMKTSPHDLVGNLDVSAYPSLRDWLKPARIAETPGDWVRAPRVQHRLFGDHRMSLSLLALPTTLATIDPLHSTGLAHAITGAQRAADIIARGVAKDVARYEDQVECEIDLLDRVISLAYRVWQRCDLFFDACMLYFALAIGDEEERMARGYSVTRSTWRADDQDIQGAVANAEALITAALNSGQPIDRAAFRRELAGICSVPLACREDNLYPYSPH